jgi:hypothetical protein
MDYKDNSKLNHIAILKQTNPIQIYFNNDNEKSFSSNSIEIPSNLTTNSKSNTDSLIDNSYKLKDNLSSNETKLTEIMIENVTINDNK